MRQNPNYPRDVVDALMLAVKESAHDCKLECFVEVFCLALNPIYTGIFGASWGYQSRQKKKKKKKQVSLSLITTERFFFLVDMVQKKRPSIYQKSQEFRLGEVDKNRVFLQP